MILDANALSALAQKVPALLERLSEARRVATTLISLGEYKYGIARSREKEELEHWLAAFLERAEVHCPDMNTLPHYASVRCELREAGTPIPANDCRIAALARQHAMPLLSRDQHFDVVRDIRRLTW